MYISAVGHVKRFIMLNAFCSGLGNKTSAFECKCAKYGKSVGSGSSATVWMVPWFPNRSVSKG